MARTVITFKRIVALVAFVFILAAGSTVIAGTIMNGKEVKPYIGHIVSHNDRTGEIVIRTANSTGHWRLSGHTAAFYGKERLQLADVWHRSKEVRVFVSTDGEVQRITVLAWK